MIRLGLVAVEENKLAELCRRYQVRELAVFGSAASANIVVAINRAVIADRTAHARWFIAPS